MANVNLSDILTTPAAPTDKPPISINGRVKAWALGNAAEFIDVVLSGALTAGTYKDVLTLSAPGVLKFCGLRANDATARNITLRLVIDGVTAFDQTVATSAANNGILAAGMLYGTSVLVFDRIPFNTLTVSIKSDLTETDKLSSLITYDLV